MERKPLRIGSLTFEYPFVLAPLAGITDRSMRSLCSRAGASLTYTEMVSAKGLWYGDRKTGELLRIGPQEGPVGYQLFGCEPEILGYAVRILSDPAKAGQVDAMIAAKMAVNGTQANAAEAAQQEELTAGNPADRDRDTLSETAEANAAGRHAAASRAPLGARTVAGLTPPALFDLNAGCPVPKIVRNGEGSALLRDPDLFYRCISAMVQAAGGPAEHLSANNSSSAAGRQPIPSTLLPDRAPAENHSDVPGSKPIPSILLPDRAPAENNSVCCTSSGPIPVTVKIRKGFSIDDDCAVEIARAAEAAGAAAVTVHGRTRQQFYDGRADWDVIARVKAAVNIPVIGNGDIYTGADAIRMMEETGCDGVMIARGALGNPWIFSQARALWDGASEADLKTSAVHPLSGNTAPEQQTNSTSMKLQADSANPELRTDNTAPESRAGSTIPAPQTDSTIPEPQTDAVPGALTNRCFPVCPTDRQRIDLLMQHIDLVCGDKGDHIALREMRKHVGWYIKGMRGATQIRRRINTAGTISEMKEILLTLC